MRSIRLQLLSSFLLLTVVMSIVVSAFSFFISQAMTKTRLRELYSLSLDYVCTGLNSKIDDIYNLSDYIFTNSTIKDAIMANDRDPVTANELKVQAIKELNKYTAPEFFENINRITVTGSNGFYLRNIINYTDYIEDGLGIYYADWTNQAQLSRGQSLWSNVITRKLNPYQEVSVAIQEAVLFRVIKNHKYTNEIGMFYISVNSRLFLDQVFEYNTRFPDYQACTLFVVDDAFEIVGSELCPLNKGEIRTLVAQNQEEASSGIFNDQINSTVYVKAIANNWHLIGLLPQSMYIASNQYMAAMSLVIFPLCILMCSLIWFYISSGIFRPLRNISKSMVEIAEGNTSLRIHYMSDNEVGQLGKNLNQMLEKIEILNRENHDKEIRMINALNRVKQAQINPHFIYNSLNSIRWMAMIAHADNIKNAIDALWTIEKYHTNSENKAFSTIAEEINIVKQYIYLQKLSYGDRFNLLWDVAQDMENIICIRFFMQPLVENAIKHGVLPKCGQCRIGVSIYQEGNEFVFNIYDDGAGISDIALKRLIINLRRGDDLGHVGLFNIYERMRYAYGDAFTFDISSSEGVYTNVMIKMPLHRQEEKDETSKGKEL